MKTEFQTVKENVQANVRSLGIYVSKFILPDVLAATPQAFFASKTTLIKRKQLLT